MMIGTLREQITYPDPPLQQREKKGDEDMELKRLLEHVHLGYILDRHGLDAEQVLGICALDLISQKMTLFFFFFRIGWMF